MEKKPLNRPDQDRPPLIRPRALLVALRWMAAAAWMAIVLAWPNDPAPPPILLHAAAYALLSFLLANALWQHIPLKHACAAAFACAVLAAVIGTLLLHMQPSASSSLIALAASAGGAAVGSAAAYPLLQRIDRLVAER